MRRLLDVAGTASGQPRGASGAPDRHRTGVAPARNLPWSRRVRAPRAHIASAPGAKSPPNWYYWLR